MSTATMEEVQARLPELLAGLAAGDGLVITRDGRPVARLTPEVPPRPRTPGRGKGKLVIHSDDNDHLADFAGYM